MEFAMSIARTTVIAVLALCAACAEPGRDDPPLSDVTMLESPAGPGSGEPNLFAGPDGRVYMSWIESRDEDESALLLTIREPDASWGPVHTIAQGAHWFVNWADFPSVIALSDGSLAAHWLVRAGPGTYAYDVHIARSNDRGVTWSESVVPHRDGTPTEHGFVSLFPWHDGRLAAVWLDGRKFEGSDAHGDATREMTLRHTLISADGALAEEILLDDRICDCCQTSAAITAAGPVIVYRDRSAEEVRDISITRYVDGAWTEPAPVHADDWTINACPVNGPAVAAREDRVLVAWFTGADDTPSVRVAFSNDSGATFDAPITVDEGDPVGRVAAALLDDGSALVTWLERLESGAAVRVRRVAPTGDPGPPVTVAVSSDARASGFPRMAISGDDVLFAWTQPGRPAQVQLAAARLTVR